MPILSTIEKCLDNAERLNGELNSFLKVERDYALNRAAELENSGAEEQSLKGAAIAVKDNICTSFSQTSCGSRILGGYRPQYNATAVERLLKAGAIIVGKTNMDEFAMGSSNENSAFGTVKILGIPRAFRAEVRAARRSPSLRAWFAPLWVRKPAARFVSPRRFAASSV
jgi:aspartyl-tRNA(Asn)/glutamyl-tRNA(Gln) amidotransferase subunit A